NGAGQKVTYGGANGYAVHAQAPPLAEDFLRLLTSREVQTRISELGYNVPANSGADLGLEDPLLADVADTVLGTSYHQLYLDQAMGPIAGNVVNEVAKQLGTGAIDSETATDTIASAWDDFVRAYRPDRT
ncbi:MAG: hypothetical protein AAGF49_12785, partial [Pseudomonadota bacterium]